MKKSISFVIRRKLNIFGKWDALSIIALSALMFSVQLSAQPKGKAEFNLTLRDGNIITGTSKISSVELKTDYGTTTAATAYPTYGNLVYKIGESGQTMRAGAKFSGMAKASGILFLSIYETVFNAGNSGFYTVKLAVK